MLMDPGPGSQDGVTGAGCLPDKPAAPERLGRPGPAGWKVPAVAAAHYQGSVVETVNTTRPSLLATSSVIFWSPLASVPVYFSANENLLKS